MSFRRIEYFLSVAKHLNFTKAARECYVAQAAISQQIKQFEEELGFKLFDRGGTAVALTPAGEYFARQCQSVLSQYHGAVKQARSIADGKKQDLRLGINGPYTQESIPGYLRQFRQLYPEAAIHLREGGREEILDALFQEELDVIVVPDYDLELDQRFDVLELNSERAKFMTGPHTPLAGRQYVSPEELVGQTIFRVEGLSEDPPRLLRPTGTGREPGPAGKDLSGGHHSGAGRFGHRRHSRGDGGEAGPGCKCLFHRGGLLSYPDGGPASAPAGECGRGPLFPGDSPGPGAGETGGISFSDYPISFRCFPNSGDCAITESGRNLPNTMR